jgi:excisionase family DNA binding protein
MKTKEQKQTKADIPILALRVEDAAKSLGIGRTTLFNLVSEGLIRSVKVKSRTIIPISALNDFLAAIGGAA